MKLDISIQSSDPNVGNEIAKAKIADGITIKRKLVLREAIGISFSDFLFVIENIGINVAASLIAAYLYDKLKGRKDTNLIINNKSVEINAEKIEKLIINILKAEEED
jgi:hypothetical protein